METKKLKNFITPEFPISTVSTTQTDYGSTTTATESSIVQKSVKQEIEIAGDRYQSSIDSRFSPHGEQTVSHKTTGFNYRPLNSSRKSSTLNQESRFPSFVNLPDVSTGRFRTHPMENSSKLSHQKAHTIKILEHSLNVLNHICIGFVTIYLSWLCLRNGLAGTALHAWFVTIGFSCLMAEGIMCHYPANVFTNNYNRDTKTRIHWILQSLGGGIGMIGTLIKLLQKEFLLKTTHGQLGFAAFLLCGFSLVSGLSALYSMRIKKLLSPLLNKTVHNLIGYFTFFIALLAQFYGYKTGFFRRKTESDFQDLMKVITLLALTLTSIGPIKALSRKCHNIYSQYMR